MNKKGKHQTLGKELKPSIKWLESQEIITKIVLGVSKLARHGYKPGTIRFQRHCPGGMKLKGYDGNGVLNLYVKVKENDKERLLEKISSRFS